jgi:DNA-binding cell septation regulator SpoVG
MDFADGSALDRCSILHPTGRSIKSRIQMAMNEEYFKESESRFEKASYMKR